MLQVTCYFIDHKTSLLLKTDDWKTRLIKWGVELYKPFARLRFTKKISAALFEYPIFQWFVRRVRL